MVEEPSVDEICILLVDADTSSLAHISTLLVEVNYEVVTASNAKEALTTLQHKLHGIELVLTATNLPDMCPFEFAGLVEKNTRLPVVMICETYDGPTMLRGLLSGAMFSLAKPVHLHHIRNLWQHRIVKGAEVMLESLEFSVTGLESCESSMTSIPEPESVLHKLGSSQGPRKRKLEEMEKVEAFSWTPHLQENFMQIIHQIGVYNVNPMEVLGRMDVPGLTLEHVVKKLQQYHIWLIQQQQQLQSMMVSRRPTFCNSGYCSGHGMRRRENGRLLSWLAEYEASVYSNRIVWGKNRVNQVLTSPIVPPSAMPFSPPAWRMPAWLLPGPRAKAVDEFIPSPSSSPVAEAPSESSAAPVRKHCEEETESEEVESQAMPSPNMG